MLPDQIKVVDRVLAKAGSLRTLAQSQHDFLSSYTDSRGLALRSIPITGQTFGVVDILIETIRLTIGFNDLKLSNASLTPQNILVNIEQNMTVVESNLGQLGPIVDLLKSDTRPLVIVDGSVIALENGEGLANLGTPIIAIAPPLESLETQLGMLVSISRVTRRTDPYEKQLASIDLRDSSESLVASRQIAAQIAAVLADVKRAAGEGIASNTELSAAATQAKLQLDQTISAVEQGKARVDAVKSESDATLSASQQDRSKISELLTAVATAETNASAASGRLAQADQKLTELETKFGTEQSLIEEMRTQVSALIVSAEDMLKGATVAGLAKAFNDERREIDRKMLAAFWGFILGISILLLLSGILVAYVLGIQSIGPIKFSPNSASALGTISIPGIMARSLILLAPFWLALFSARRYNHLFSLRRQYSHKYNLAFSVEGFKKQAPKYGDEIAALVFQSISANPMTNAPSSHSMGESPLQGIPEMFASFDEKVLSALRRVATTVLSDGQKAG